MKITKNEDGTLVVSVLKAPERYDTSSGDLYIDETIAVEDLDALVTEALGKDEPTDG